MSFTGFTEKDFNVFNLPGLDERMDALKENIRPKLDELGQFFAPSLSSLTGDEMYPHVAKHARRTKNPPNDTWVAFANNPRGYKMLPHFQIGLWESHVFIWFALIYEAQNKDEFGMKLQRNLDALWTETPKDFVWSIDHTKPNGLKHGDLAKDELLDLFIKLQTVKKAEILCGYHISREEAIQMRPNDFLNKVDSIFNQLLPLYKLR